MPWNQYTKVGYVVEIGVIIVMGEAYLLTFLLMFISICWHYQAFSKMHRFSLRQLDYPDSERNDKVLLCHLIHFKIQAKK